MDQRAMELLHHGLQDMYDAEQRFAASLETMQRNASDKALANSFKRHRDVTLNQAKRIEKAFKEMGETASAETCKAAQGLVDEYESFAADHRGGDSLHDAFAATAGLKVEHYEIASYRALVNLAEFCGQDAVAKLLAQNLTEEEQAAAEMMTASTKLSAKLAGASTAKVAQRAVGSMLDHARENAFAAVGGMASVAGRAADRVGSRGRNAKGKSKSGGNSGGSKAKSTAKSATNKAKSTAKSSGSKAKSTAKSAARKATPNKSTARKATKAAPKKSGGRSTARRKASSR